MKRILGFLGLFSSLSTLICCALPALLVSIGAGSVLAGFIGTFPGFTLVSQYKTPLFIFAFVMLVLSYAVTFKRNTSCPTDKELAKHCEEAKGISKIIFWISVVLYIIGFFFAYLLPLFL